MTGFALQLLMLSSYCGVSSRCVLKVTVLGFLMASRIAGRNVGVSLQTLNYTTPNLDDAG